MKPGAFATERSHGLLRKGSGERLVRYLKGIHPDRVEPFFTFRQEMLQISENRHRKGKIPPSPPLFPYKFLVFFSL